MRRLNIVFLQVLICIGHSLGSRKNFPVKFMIKKIIKMRLLSGLHCKSSFIYQLYLIGYLEILDNF